MFRKTVFLSCVALAAMSAEAQVASFGDAQLFNDGWKFSLKADSTAVADDYDDSQWEALTLPHDWSIKGQLSPSLASCTGYLPGGIGWYRKTFTLNDDMPQHYLYFEGVYNRSEVYLNGHLLGMRPNGYVSFMYDITPYLRDGENTLTVKVDHSRNADSRWYTGSGIYRDVYLVSAPETHFDLWGVGYKATKITDKRADIAIDAKVVNPQRGMSLVATLSDRSGKTVATRKAGAVSTDNTMNLSVDKPHRWNLDDPYLYTLTVKVMDGDKVVDQTSTRVGLRTLEFDPNTGFALNGKNMKVKGVCLHHDAGVLGAVVPEEVWRRRIEKLKDIGVNGIRMSHNPQAPVLYDLCDELGMLVMDEASDEWEFPKRKWVEGWNRGEPAFDGTYDFFEEWIDRDITDMVRRDRNHPSIILWSIGNEVDYPNDPYSHPILDGGEKINQPMFGGYNPDAPRAERIGKIAKRLVACVKAVDDSRPTTGALAGVVMSNETEYPQAVDVCGYNYTENRYISDHETYPDRVIYGSETGVGYPQWVAVRDNDHIFGQFIWTGTDYLGEAGAWPSRGLGTGLLDFASCRKPIGQFRASLWAEEPMAYIGTYPIRNDRHRGGEEHISVWSADTWNYEEGDNVRVVACTNAPQARLLLNDNVVGEMKVKDPSNGLIYWDIPFASGTLKVEGCDDSGTMVAEYSITTSGRPYKLRAYFDDPKTASVGNVRHVMVEVLDENDNLVKLADNEIMCRTTDGATLLGLENGDNQDMSEHRDNRQRVHRGTLLAYVKVDDISKAPTVKFTSPLLQSVTISLAE